ncbi:MAG: hypothetical protein H7Z43_03275 [Clostridia bacterium]|nr:hypothetical protein [Deltaproteobacteria bacterium]
MLSFRKPFTPGYLKTTNTPVNAEDLNYLGRKNERLGVRANASVYS